MVDTEKENTHMTATNAARKAPKIQLASIDNIYQNPENVRNIENYDVAAMISKIVALGKVVVPIFTLPADTEGEYKGKRLSVDGNRRVKSLQIIASRAKAQEENQQDKLDASIATIEGVQSKQMADAAKEFDYLSVSLDIPFIEISKEQAEDEKEMLKLQLITGSSAKALTPSEYAAGVIKLLAENDGDELRTAFDLGNNKAWVQTIARVYVGINKDDKLIKMIDDGRIDVDLGDQIGAFSRKSEIAIGTLVEEVLSAAAARGKVKATKKDLDTVKASHSQNNVVDPDNVTPPVDPEKSTPPKPIRTREDSKESIREFITFVTQQLQRGFEGFDDETLSALATKTDGLHLQLIKKEEKAAKIPDVVTTPNEEEIKVPVVV